MAAPGPWLGIRYDISQERSYKRPEDSREPGSRRALSECAAGGSSGRSVTYLAAYPALKRPAELRASDTSAMTRVCNPKVMRDGARAHQAP